MNYIPMCLCHIRLCLHYKFTRNSTPYWMIMSRTTMIRPTTMDTTITAADCFPIVLGSGHTILENSLFKPAKRWDMVVFSFPAINILLYSRNPITWFLCAKCVSCRNGNTCWFPSGPDALSCLLSCCNFAAGTLYMPKLFSCAQLPPPLNFLCFFMPRK